jgi:exopolyphosphatase/guanosine-5'-triphosphate,3'-diphosphate pyrophosphatase
MPKKSSAQMRSLNKKDCNAVKVNSTFLSIAEALDRSHQGVVKNAHFSRDKNGMIYLDVECNTDCQLELWRLNSHNKLFGKVFKKQIEVQTIISVSNKERLPQPAGE